MDRPVRIDRLQNPSLGLKTIEGINPTDLARLADRVFANAAGADPNSWVCGMSLGGGGDGASWRCTFTLGNLLGPGPTGQDSVYTGRGHCWFAHARHSAELDTVCNKLVDDIAAAYPNAFVAEVQIAGGGRDGAYLVAALFDEEMPQPPVNTQFNGAEVTGIGVATDHITVTLPGTVSGGPNDQVGALLSWSIAVQGTTATSFTVGLWNGTAFIEEYTRTVVSNTDWECYAGSIDTLQATVDTDYSIRIVPVGGNVAVRDASLAYQFNNRAIALS